MLVWFAHARRARRVQIVAAPRGARGAQPASTRSASSSSTAGTASWCSAPWCSSSPAARRSTPTWATSAAPHPPRLVPVRLPRPAAQLLRPGRARSREPQGGVATRSTPWSRARSLSAGALATWPRSSLRRRSSPAPSRSPSRPCSSASSRASPSSTPRAKPRGKSTSPRSTLPSRSPASGWCSSFQESSALAAAYGIAVTGTMAITSIVYYVVVTRDLALAACGRPAPLVGLFLVFDLAFFVANLLKFFDGGWFPIAVATVIFMMMTTWKTGRAPPRRNLAEQLLPLDVFLDDLANSKPPACAAPPSSCLRTPTACRSFCSTTGSTTRCSTRRSSCSRSSPRTCPRSPSRERVHVKDLGHGFFQSPPTTGSCRPPTCPRSSSRPRPTARRALRAGQTSYYLGRETLLATRGAACCPGASALLVHLAQRPLGDAVLRHPPRPRGRAGHAVILKRLGRTTQPISAALARRKACRRIELRGQRRPANRCIAAARRAARRRIRNAHRASTKYDFVVRTIARRQTKDLVLMLAEAVIGGEETRRLLSNWADKYPLHSRKTYFPGQMLWRSAERARKPLARRATHSESLRPLGAARVSFVAVCCPDNPTAGFSPFGVEPAEMNLGLGREAPTFLGGWPLVPRRTGLCPATARVCSAEVSHTAIAELHNFIVCPSPSRSFS